MVMIITSFVHVLICDIILAHSKCVWFGCITFIFDRNEEEENVMKCRWCHRIFDDEDVLMEHQNKLHTKQCKECDLKFRTTAELEEHELNDHDPFNEDAKEQDISMRVNEKGIFLIIS